MGNFFSTLIDDSDYTSEPVPINSETESQIPIIEHDTIIIEDYERGLETKHDSRMSSKKSLLLLDNEKLSMHEDSEKVTENLNCKLPDLLQTEEKVPNISNKTQTECTITTGQVEKINNNTSKHASMDKQNEFPKLNINNAGKGLKRANSNSTTTKKSIKQAKSSLPTVSKSKDLSEKKSSFSMEYKFNINATIQCMDSLISRRRIIYRKRREAREKLAKIENEAPSNIRKQKKKKPRRSPRTKKLNLTFSSMYIFNPNSSIQCMDSIIQRRRFIFDKKEKELKKCKKDKKDQKQKPKTNKKNMKNVRKQSNNQNNAMLHSEDNKLSFVELSDMSYYSSCIFCNKNHEFPQANTCLPKQCKEKFTKPQKTWSRCVVM